MKKKSYEYLFLVAAAVLLIAAISVILEIPSIFETKTIHQTGKKISVVNKSMSIIDKALEIEPNNIVFSYTNSFENPFRKQGETGPITKVSQTEMPDRPKLKLKGVLLKENALAIIEDERGQTYIRGIGDTIPDQQTIISIKNNRVILRDRKGSYELTVEEH